MGILLPLAIVSCSKDPFDNSALEKVTYGPIHGEFHWRKKFYETLSVMEAGAELGAIGPYSIHHDFWADAVEFDPTIGGLPQDCERPWYSHRIINAYFQRYCPDEWVSDGKDMKALEVLARTFNGGPKGRNKATTADYGQRFVNLFKAMRNE